MAPMCAMAMALMLGMAAGKAVNPEEATPDAAAAPAAVARLRSLVSDMEARQPSVAAAPEPQPVLLDDDAVIVEAHARRELGSCKCKEYRNGALKGSQSCVATEGSKKICYPRNSYGKCDSGMSTCGGGGGGLSASPAPSSRMLADAEVTDEPGEAYLNVNFQIHNANVASESQLPPDEAFVDSLASHTGTSKQKLLAYVRWAEGASQGSAATSAPQAGTATLHATFTVSSAKQREALEAQLQLTEELPQVNGLSFRVVLLTVNDEDRYPRVCARNAKKVEVEQQQRGTRRISNATECDAVAPVTPPQQKIWA